MTIPSILFVGPKFKPSMRARMMNYVNQQHPQSAPSIGMENPIS
jgi:hypothetical protein